MKGNALLFARILRSGGVNTPGRRVIFGCYPFCRTFPIVVIALVTLYKVSASLVSPRGLKVDDWPQWRGPQRDGV